MQGTSSTEMRQGRRSLRCSDSHRSDFNYGTAESTHRVVLGAWRRSKQTQNRPNIPRPKCCIGWTCLGGQKGELWCHKSAPRDESFQINTSDYVSSSVLRSSCVSRAGTSRCVLFTRRKRTPTSQIRNVLAKVDRSVQPRLRSQKMENSTSTSPSLECMLHAPGCRRTANICLPTTKTSKTSSCRTLVVSGGHSCDVVQRGARLCFHVKEESFVLHINVTVQPSASLALPVHPRTLHVLLFGTR